VTDQFTACIQSYIYANPDLVIMRGAHVKHQKVLCCLSLTAHYGVKIHVKSFPGWDSFAVLIKHLKFIKDHHQKIACVAFSTDSPIGELAKHVASHFTNAEIKHFSFDQLNEANNWI